MSDTLIKVEGISKKFCRSLKKSLWYGMQDLGNEVLGRRHGGNGELRSDEFWAVKDVSFELKRGECLGLIGRNGAGKTTLLKVLNGLIKPDSGHIEMRGRVGALIALGAGFNPILTGRENIYVNASVLGFTTTEIDAKLDEIIDFADIDEFIDSPVQNYSSGMQVRLGFAVATALEPDILLLDEVLAVGDAAFRNKCYNRIGKLRRSAAIIFVSHSMEQVAQICDLSLMLSRGETQYIGSVDECIKVYDNENKLCLDDGTDFETLEAPITNFSVTINKNIVFYGETLNIEIEVFAESNVKNAIFRIVFYDERQIPFAEWNSGRIGFYFDLEKGKNKFEVNVGPIQFKTGTYCFGININDNTGMTMLVWSYKKYFINVMSFTGLGPNISFNSIMKRIN